MFLLDTVVLSEMRKRRPGAQVVRWLKAQPESALFLSVVSLGEIERGIEKQRRENAEFASELSRWLETLQNLYADRILPITAPIARRWGVLSARLGQDDLFQFAVHLCAGTGAQYGVGSSSQAQCRTGQHHENGTRMPVPRPIVLAHGVDRTGHDRDL